MGNIVLIGFMGAGKSAVGHKLAERLGMVFVDTDELIEKKEGMDIAEIFRQRGEEYFRDAESDVLRSLGGREGLVISTGGGIVLKKENAAALKKLGPVILLTADAHTIHERVKKLRTRPLLNVPDPKQKIKEILAHRDPVYNSLADLTVDTSAAGVDQCAEKIITFLKEKQ